VSQTPEKRIYLHYLSYRRRTRCWGGHWNGIGGLRLRLARQWKRPCQEIKAIIASKGFHDPAIHQARQVPKELTWKAGELAPWQRDQPGPQVPTVVKEDAAAVLGVLKGLSEQDL
jgi:hypothetical protein